MTQTSMLSTDTVSHSNTPSAQAGMPPGVPVFQLERVVKKFGHQAALRGVSLAVRPGEFVLVLGNNGAGKSTLFKLLSTLMRPTTGQIFWGGLPLHQAASAARRELGVISHDSRLYGDLTAEENLRVFGTLYGVDRLTQRIGEALEQVGLSHVAGFAAGGFSSGMTKRLAIARLLLYRPRVLLLDEPHSGLDLNSIRLLDDYLARFKQEGGTTLLITHQFTKGVNLAERVVILRDGRVAHDAEERGPSPARLADLLLTHG
ncbi:MAG: heme ABC exporter ATP-binding protein CcmA [Deltaproteobacteria bacterium]|nr:heme ABC exporter ATP-binding protein CcmA [Deltaproteobacteria bacterium]